MLLSQTCLTFALCCSGKYDELLSHPGTCKPQQLKRVSASYRNEVRPVSFGCQGLPCPCLHSHMERLLCLQGERFKLNHRVYDRQYAQIYFQRLMMLKPKLLQQVKKLWPGVAGDALVCLVHSGAADGPLLMARVADAALQSSLLEGSPLSCCQARQTGPATWAEAIFLQEAAFMGVTGTHLSALQCVAS